MASDDAKKCTYFERHGYASEETDALDKSADQGCGAPHHALVRCPDRGADHRHTGDGASAGGSYRALHEAAIQLAYTQGSASAGRAREAAALKEKNPKAELRQRWVPYGSISVHLKRAVITSEDARFSEHEGVDWEAIEKAYKENQKRGRAAKGGSTITQQLAKNLFLSPERSYLRKGQELVITYMIEALWDKRRILEVYLNVAEWGTGVYGAEAASRHHFRKPAHDLTEEEAAWLAAMLPAPRRYDPMRRTKALTSRYERVLHRMNQAAQAGFMNAWAAAAYLVERGVPSRLAHEAVGKAVQLCVERGCELRNLTLGDLHSIHEAFKSDFPSYLGLTEVLGLHDVPGGTAPRHVKRALQSARARVAALRAPEQVATSG